MGVNQKINGAIVGLGPHGQRWLNVIRESSAIELIGLVDQRQETLRVIDSPAVKFSSLDELFRSKPVELLIIATNGPSHASIAIQAMKAGVKFIVVEKPMACSVAECEEMIRLSEELRVRLAVGKINRHDPAMQFIKEKIDSKEWGELRTIYIQRPGIGLGCIGIHSFDVVNYLMGGPPQRVTGWLDKPIQVNPRGKEFSDPGGLVVMEYANGVRAVVSQIEDGGGPQTMEINLTAARISHDPKNDILDILVRDLAVKKTPDKAAAYARYELPGMLSVKGNMLAQMKSVLEELIGSAPMLADARFGKQSVEVLVASYVSHANGNTPVNLPLTGIKDLHLFLPIT